MRFTFKKDPRQTGLASVGYPDPDTVIKHDGRMVGVICAPNWQGPDNKWSVCLYAPAADSVCGWKVLRMKKRFDTEPEARAALQASADTLIPHLHHMEKQESE